jgi:hypothetical protein
MELLGEWVADVTDDIDDGCGPIVLLTTYELAIRDLSSLCAHSSGIQWKYLVVDEAHR